MELGTKTGFSKTNLNWLKPLYFKKPVSEKPKYFENQLKNLTRSQLKKKKTVLSTV